MALSLSEKVMYSVLHISMLNATHQLIGTATGFLFGFCDDGTKQVTCLVTNRHVLSKCSFVQISLTRKKTDGTPDIGNLATVTIPTAGATYHPNPDIDLAILPVAQAIRAIAEAGAPPFFTIFTSRNIPSKESWSNFSAIESVFMAGYPKGFRDQTNNQPIFRSGITATHPALNFNGRPEFLIDMPCFEGCSGSPIFICDEGLHIDKKANAVSAGDKFELLGIQYAIPLDKSIVQLATATIDRKPVPAVPLYMNLGFIIKSTELLVFEDLVRAKLNS